MPDGKPDWSRAQKIIAAAERAGTHSAAFRTVCSLCGQWCDGVYHRTLDGKRACEACADAMGALNHRTQRGDPR